MTKKRLLSAAIYERASLQICPLRFADSDRIFVHSDALTGDLNTNFSNDTNILLHTDFTLFFICTRISLITRILFAAGRLQEA